MARVTLREYCAEARELTNSGAYDEAIAICRHILMRYPQHVETYQILGEACLEKGELDEAADVFKRLLSADPENFAAYAGLSVVSEENGQLDEAIKYMEKAFGLEPNSDVIRNALRRLYGKRDGAEPTRIKLNKVALARLYAKGGQYRQAIEEFQHLLESEPTRMDIKVSLTETLWRDGQREQAAQLAREILQTAPYCLKVILILGKILIDKGRGNEGRAILAKARGLDPENNLAQRLFAEHSPLPSRIIMIPRMEKRNEAVPREVPEPAELSTIAEASTIEDDEPPPNREIEVATEEATLAATDITISASLSDIERYKLQLEQKPKDNETRLALARAYRDQEQIKLALEQYRALLRAKPQFLSQVISDMESIVASRPDNLEAHELLADLYVKTGQLQKALDRYRWILQRIEPRPT